MISLKREAITNAAHAASYYMKQDGYYFKQVYEQSFTAWYGQGAVDLGLEGKVSEKALYHVLEGRTPDGKDRLVPEKEERRCGWEVCFNLPKSVSMAILMHQDQKLLEAVRSVPQEIVKQIQQDCAQAKHTKNNQTTFEKTNHLMCAVIEHVTSKRNDPHLHYHMVFPNLTKDEVETWRAMASSTQKNEYGDVQGFSETIFRDSVCYGTLARKILEEKVRALGYSTRPAGKNGLWELTCYADEALKTFSTASKEIAAGIESMGEDIDDPKMRDLVNAILRQQCPNQPKVDNLMDQLKTLWLNQFEEQGYAFEKPDPTKIKQDESYYSIEAEIAMERAVEHLSAKRTRLTYTEILKEALIFSMGKGSLAGLTAAYDRMQKSGEVIPLDKEGRTVATKLSLKAEENLKALVELRSHATKANSNINNTTSVNRDKVVETIVNGKENLMLVESKQPNFDYGLLQKTCLERGENLLVLTANASQAVALKEDLKDQSKQGATESAIDWIKRTVSKPPAELEVKSVKSFLYRGASHANALVVVDRTDDCSLDDVQKLLKVTDKTNQKLVCLTQKHKPLTFTAGMPTETLKKEGVKTLSVIQRDTPHIEPPKLCAIKDKQERLTMMATVAVSRDALCLTSTTDSKNKLTALVRDQKIQAKQLGEKAFHMNVLQPKYLDPLKKKVSTTYQKGQICRNWSSKTKTFLDRTISWVDKKNNQLFFEGQHPPMNLNRNPSFQLMNSKTLEIRSGEKLEVLGKTRDLNLPTGTRITIDAFTHNHVQFCIGQGKKIHKTSRAAFDGAQLKYDYAHLLAQTDHRKHKNVCVDLPYHVSNQSNLDRILSKVAHQGECVIFTNDAVKTERRFQTEVNLQSVSETVLEAAGLPTQLKGDASLSLAQQRLHAKANRTPADIALDNALAMITSREAAFDQSTLFSKIAEEGLLNSQIFTATDMKESIAKKLDTGELIQGKPYWTTKAMVQLEQSIIDRVNAGINQCAPLKRGQMKMPENMTLTADQQKGISQLLKSRDRFMVVQGYAGVGKTTVLKVLQDNLPKKKQLKGIAPTKQAVEEMQKAGIPAQTMQSWMIEMEKAPEDLTNVVLVLDEASMVDNATYDRLQFLIDANHGRLGSFGDRTQHPSPRSGKPYILVQDHSNISVIELKESVRPQNEFTKGVFKALQNQDYQGAIRKVADNQTFFNLRLEKGEKGATFDEAMEAVSHAFAERFLNLDPNIRERACFILPTHSLRDLVHENIRDGLKKEHRISAQDQTIQTLETKRQTLDELRSLKHYESIDVIKMGSQYFDVLHEGVDTASNSVMIRDQQGNTQPFFPEKVKKNVPMAFYEKKDIAVSVGDRLRLTESAGSDQKRQPNQTFQVTGVNDSVITLQSEMNTTDIIKMETKHYLDRHLDYAYTTTSQSAQGITRDLVLTAQLSLFKKLATTQALNINFTRAREQILVICDNLGDYFNVFQDGEKLSAMEAVGLKGGALSLTPIEEKLKAHYDRLCTTLFKASVEENGLSSFKDDNYMVYYDRENRHISWVNMATNTQGDGFLSYIQDKEQKLNPTEMKQYGVTILADCQAKASLEESQKRKDASITPLKASTVRCIEESQPIKGTVGESYFNALGMEAPNHASIRFHDKVFCAEDRQYHPAILTIGQDEAGKPVQCQAIYLDGGLGNSLDNKTKLWGAENVADVIFNANDESLTWVTHNPDTGFLLQSLVTSQVSVVQDWEHLNMEQMNAQVVLCVEESLLNNNYLQEKLNQTVARLEACGKEVMIHYEPDISGEKYHSIGELYQAQGKEAAVESLTNVQPVEAILSEVRSHEKAINEELLELNQSADHEHIKETEHSGSSDINSGIPHSPKQREEADIEMEM